MGEVEYPSRQPYALPTESNKIKNLSHTFAKTSVASSTASGNGFDFSPAVRDST